jgi:hypothetical protein
MSRFSAILAILSLGLVPADVTAAPPEKVSERVTLTLVPAATSIYVGDPLIVKGVLTNRGKPAVTLSKPFGAYYGGVRFEVCPPDGTLFERVMAVGEGRFCGMIKGKIEVGASTSVVGYERLYWERGKPVCSTAGKWRVRTLVTIGDEVVASEPVAITATNPSERVKKAFAEHSDLISQRLVSWVSSADDLKAMPGARDRLEGSYAAQIIAQSLLLCALDSAGSAKARQFALDAIDKHRATLSPVAREELDLLTAEALCSHGDYSAAKKRLDAIPERSHVRDGLRGTVNHLLAAERK